MRLKTSVFCLAATCLAACATTADSPPTPSLDGLSLSSLTIPDALPALDDPLGFLRPDAGSVRKDVEIITDPYVVTGSTPDDILHGEDGILSTVTDEGKSFVARVDWRVSWRYDYSTALGQCRAEDVETDLSVTYRLPDWQPTEPPAAGLTDYWNAFEDDLWTHEYGHALIGYRAKQDIQTVLSEADISDPDCDRVGEALNALGNAIVKRGLDADYDAQTGHGRTQGATFSVREARAAIRAARNETPPEG